jgi:hypothetical protein
MYRIDDKYSGKEKRKLLEKTRKNEPMRQQLRKIQHPVSRELDNYFQPKLHERGWYPNGKYRVKQYYYYANPGLGYNYEKNNVEQLKDLLELQKEKLLKQKEQYFIDFEYMEENQYIITIEFCSNCKEHENFTSHHADLYKNYALSLQKCILLRFPFISILLKPIETDIKKGEKYKLPKMDKFGRCAKQYLNDQFKDVKIGAFEVELCFKYNKQKNVVLLHSKLATKKWPKIDNILNKIVSYMPRFNARIIVYQKETEEEEKDQTQKEEEKNQNGDEGERGLKNQDGQFQNRINEENDTFKIGLIDGLRINIYLRKNNQITQISNSSWEDIQNEKDPHKRRIMNREKKILEKQEMFKSGNGSSVIENKNFNRSRPASAFSGRKNYSINKNSRPSSSKNRVSLYTDNDHINSCINPMEQNLILDKRISQNLKGKLIISKYTNNKGYIDIGPLPYDSYYIEVSESKQYRSIGMCLVFSKLPSKNNNYIKRYIGLYTQENSFIQIHVFETKKDEENKDDPIHISNATVTMQAMRDENKEDYLEDKEWKFEIKEKENSPGIFEQTVPPGKYLLKIQKENYETIAKTCLLQKGLNCINIELFKERTCKLVIKVFNFEKITKSIHSPVQNADVVIYQNSNEILEQGITDEKGSLEYIVDKGEDFLTIVINKMGFFPIQRTFIRDKSMIINEEDQYYEEMSFFLVKKSFIYNERCMLFTIYSNIKKENFSFESIGINHKVNKEKNQLSCLNGQESDGMLSIFIPCKDNTEMDNTKTQTQNNFEIQNNENKFCDGVNEKNNYQENQNQEKEEITGNINNEEYDENYNNNESQNTEAERKENFDYIMNLTLEIKSEELLIHNYQDKGHVMNGLERFGCQTIIYTQKNTFYVNSPIYCREGYKYWNIGWVDLKNELYYQTNILIENRFERVEFLSLWIDFLQTLITKQIYKNLFESFGFEGSALIDKDRYIYEPILKKKLTSLKFCDEKENEILQFICDLFKSNNNMISYSLIKKKITSNLKNFFDGNMNNSSASLGLNSNIGDC